MKRKITSILASITIISLLLSVYQPSSAVTYTGHDGSVDEHVEKVKVKPMKGKNGLYHYQVRICADEYPIKPIALVLKSDREQIILSGFKVIKAGECQLAGAIMNAKNSDTLGAELLEQHEAIQKMKDLIAEKKHMSGKDKKKAMKEIMQLYMMLQYFPK